MMLLRFILFVSVCFLAPAGSVWGQGSDDGPLIFPIYPKVGQAWLVNVLGEKTTARDDTVTSINKVRIVAVMEITDVSELGYDILWKTRSVSDGAVVVDVSQVDPRLMAGVPVKARLDNFGGPSELTNWDRVREELVRNLRKQSIGWQESEFFRSVTGGWDSTTAAQILLGDLMPLSLCQSVEHRPGSRPMELAPGPLGVTQAGVTETYIPLELDRANKIVRFRVERAVDAESGAHTGRQLMEENAKRTGEDASDQIALLDRFKPEYIVTVDCTLDLVTGFATGAVHTLALKIGNEHVHMERRITLLPISGTR